MLSAKDIREIKFSRSMGGYKTAEVDEFLDRCADTVEELATQNEENTKKMQVLAETIMDYRNQEDSIRSALISAQRMSETVITDARSQANDIIEAARSEADSIHEKAQAEITAEREELNRIKREVAEFKAKLLSIYREHLTLINVLDDNDAAEEAPVEPEAEEETEIVEIAAPKEEAVPVVEQPVPYDMPDFSSLELVDEE